MAVDLLHFRQKHLQPSGLVKLSDSFCEQTDRPCGSTALLYGQCKGEENVMRIKVEGESQTARIHSSDYQIIG